MPRVGLYFCIHCCKSVLTHSTFNRHKRKVHERCYRYEWPNCEFFSACKYYFMKHLKRRGFQRKEKPCDTQPQVTDWGDASTIPLNKMVSVVPHLDSLAEAIAKTIGQLPHNPALLDYIASHEEPCPSLNSFPEMETSLHTPNVDDLATCSPASPISNSPDIHTAAGPSNGAPPDSLDSPGIKAEAVSPDDVNITGIERSPLLPNSIDSSP